MRLQEIFHQQEKKYMLLQENYITDKNLPKGKKLWKKKHWEGKKCSIKVNDVTLKFVVLSSTFSWILKHFIFKNSIYFNNSKKIH